MLEKKSSKVRRKSEEIKEMDAYKAAERVSRYGFVNREILKCCALSNYAVTQGKRKINEEEESGGQMSKKSGFVINYLATGV